MAKAEYQRLTRARARSSFAVALMSRTSLWLGTDHLLFVDASGYTETYKRFYFRDIQAFVVQKTQTAIVVNVVLTLLIVLVTTLALAIQTSGVKIFFFSLDGVLGLLGVVNLLKGRTCRCFLRTAVQTEELPPLNRVRRAQKVFARLRLLIAAAQGGELSLEAISEMMRTSVQPPAAAATVGADIPGIPPVIDS